MGCSCNAAYRRFSFASWFIAATVVNFLFANCLRFSCKVWALPFRSVGTFLSKCGHFSCKAQTLSELMARVCRAHHGYLPEPVFEGGCRMVRKTFARIFSSGCVCFSFKTEISFRRTWGFMCCFLECFSLVLYLFVCEFTVLVSFRLLEAENPCDFWELAVMWAE